MAKKSETVNGNVAADESIVKAPLTDLSLSELLTLRDAATTMYEYYDNLMRANSGPYGEQYDVQREHGMNKSVAYNNLLKRIYDEIDQRLQKYA